MKLTELHTQEKEVSTLSLFKGEKGTATAIQLKSKAVFKEHITKTPALLLCASGSVIYEDASNNKVALLSGDYVDIVPNVKHWLVADSLSQLILFK